MGDARLGSWSVRAYALGEDVPTICRESIMSGPSATDALAPRYPVTDLGVDGPSAAVRTVDALDQEHGAGRSPDELFTDPDTLAFGTTEEATELPDDSWGSPTCEAGARGAN